MTTDASDRIPEALQARLRAKLRAKLSDLPDGPGVYLFKGAKSRILYVGKAASLRKRVSSYFHARASHPERIRRMVAEARDVDWLVTGNEVEALVLESSLIKQNKPRYNVNLRDDKNYPYIQLTTSERWPRMQIARRPRADGDSYFGPYLPASAARKTMRLLAQHFGIRSCKGPIEDKDHRACLYWHIDQCLAPCAAACSKSEYDEAVREATLFLQGNDKPLKDALTKRMAEAAERQDYERAAHHRDLIRLLDRGREGRRIASTGMEQQDAWGLHREGPRAMLVVAFIREGLLRGRKEFAFKDVAEIPDAELVGGAVRQFYHGGGAVPGEVLLPVEIDEPDLTVEFLREAAGRAVRLHAPQRGARAQRVAWAAENARVGFELRFARGDAAREALEELTDLLELPAPPERIECFDISNIQGSDIVASLVVFTGGEPDKSQYRKFKIRDTSGKPDDFASMREVVARRYRRLLQEDRDLPDLVVVDGGLGQLGAAAAALDEIELSDLPLASIAKREELLHVRGREEPLRLPRTSAALQLVQRLRDEAHRFAIGFHRQRRKARTVTSVLDAVPGIGEKRRRALLRRFGSVEGVRQAGLDEVAETVGDKAARSLRAHLGEPDSA